MQEKLAYVQKENTLKNLEEELLEYEMMREFLADIRKKFGKRDEELVKVAELKRLEQGKKIIEKFVQEFKKAIKESGYEERLLVEEFKREINTTICQRLMESEQLPSLIEQWYNRTITLNRNQRESRREEIKRAMKIGATSFVVEQWRNITGEI